MDKQARMSIFIVMIKLHSERPRKESDHFEHDDQRSKEHHYIFPFPLVATEYFEVVDYGWLIETIEQVRTTFDHVDVVTNKQKKNRSDRIASSMMGLLSISETIRLEINSWHACRQIRCRHEEHHCSLTLILLEAKTFHQWSWHDEYYIKREKRIDYFLLMPNICLCSSVNNIPDW